MEKRLVTLRGGYADGEMIAVEPTRKRLVWAFDRGESRYMAGEWATPESPPMVTRLVDFEVYERVDADTFQAVAA
jgi:hypothetical protein